MKEIIKGFREAIQDLLVPELKAIKTEISYLKEATERNHNEIKELRREINERFEKMDKRFEKMDERFEKMDERFEQMNEKFTQLLSEFVEFRGEQRVINESLKKVEHLINLNGKIENITHRVQKVENEVELLKK